MYEDNADSYFDMMEKEINLPVYQDMLGGLHQNIANTPGTLVDTACGSGHMLAMFRSKFDSNRPLIGLDISPRMVALSKSLLDDDGLLMVGDMRSIPAIDYGEESEIVALRYTRQELIDVANQAGFSVKRCVVEPVEGFPMDAIYLECNKS